MTLKTFADAEQVLAKTLPGYQPRPPQQTLAKHIETTLANGGYLLAQAGTGVGKSIGYLVPSILSGERVVVATATKALQDQIGDKDLPFLREHLGIDFAFEVLKGRSNYVCLSRLDLAPISGAIKDEITRLATRVDGPTYGERDRMAAVATDEAREAIEDWKVWADICSDSDACDSLPCREEGLDYAIKARSRAKAADIVVTNHALLVIDGMVAAKAGTERSMLGDYDYVVVDEAHELEAYATNALQSTIRAVGAVNTCLQMANALDDTASRDHAAGLFDRAFDLLPINEQWPQSEHRIYHGSIINNEALAGAWADCHQFVSGLAARCTQAAAGCLDFTPEQSRFNRAARRGAALAKSIEDLLTREDHEVVRWTQVEKRGRFENKVLTFAPINPGDDLRTYIWDNVEAAVLTSATVTVNGSMSHVASRLGFAPSKRLADEGVQPLTYQTLDVGTPFNYAANCVLYVPGRSFPAPNGGTKNSWQSACLDEMIQLTKASGGRALLLFTSISEMKAAKRTLSRFLPYPMKMQGEGSTKALADWFETNETAVLLATRTFFTGVDFKGDTLRLVVLNKVPFPRYGEPLSEARKEAVEELTGDGFNGYYVPEAILPMKQAFGRLIRTHTDKGVVAILDSRINTKGYGKAMLASLPNASTVQDSDSAIKFLASL